MNNARVAVIGSGFGGLAAAIRLQAAGFPVTIFEKRDGPGGQAYAYKDNGFTFDAGPTTVTAPSAFKELFRLSGKSMDDGIALLPVKPFYRLYWEDGFSLDDSNDADLLEVQVRKKSARDTDGVRRFLAYSKKVLDSKPANLSPVPFLSWWSMIRVTPKLFQLAAYRSMFGTVSGYIQDPQLREAFGFHSLLVGGNPFTCSSLTAAMCALEREEGVFSAKGGTGALVRSLVRLFTELGGKLLFNSPVEKIVTSNGSVMGIQLESGQREAFEAVVSNADLVHTYATLLKSEPSAEPTAKKIINMSPSLSLFLIYFGVKKKYPNLAHRNVIFGSRVFPDDLPLFLNAPTRTDPSLAPDGCEAFYAFSPVPHLGKARIDWGKEGPVVAEKILNFLEKNYLPGLNENLVTRRIFTPNDFESELNAWQGSAFSVEPLFTQSAYFRPHNRDAHVRGLYFVGAGTQPGAGVPGVLNSAKATAELVRNDFGRDSTNGIKQPVLATSPLTVQAGA